MKKRVVKERCRALYAIQSNENEADVEGLCAIVRARILLQKMYPAEETGALECICALFKDENRFIGYFSRVVTIISDRKLLTIKQSQLLLESSHCRSQEACLTEQ